MPVSPHVVHMNQYRKTNMLERIIGGFAYIAFMYFGLKFNVLNMFTFILLFLVVWVITKSRAVSAPPFIKYHVAHAFAIAVLASLAWMAYGAVAEFIQATFILFEAVPYVSKGLFYFLKGNGFIQAYWPFAMLGVAGYHFIQALMGKHQEWPLSGAIARRIIA